MNGMVPKKFTESKNRHIILYIAIPIATLSQFLQVETRNFKKNLNIR